jgi:hypothetical protein
MKPECGSPAAATLIALAMGRIRSCREEVVRNTYRSFIYVGIAFPFVQCLEWMKEGAFLTSKRNFGQG